MKRILLLLFLVLSSAARAASGGPDAHVYTWFDSNSGVAFEWIDISDTGTVVLTASSPNPRKATGVGP